MATRYFKHLTIIGLRYFFNIDQTFCHQFYTVFFLCMLCIKASWLRVSEEMIAGIFTVKDDVLQAKLVLNELREKLPVFEITNTLFIRP